MSSIISKIILALQHFFISRAFGAAAGGGTTDIIPNPLAPCDNFQCIVTKVIGLLLEIAVPLTAIMVLVGGFMMITAGGDPEKFSKGKKTLLYAAIGFVVVLLANGIVQVIRSIFQ